MSRSYGEEKFVKSEMYLPLLTALTGILPDFNLAEFTEARNAGKVKLRDGKPWKDCEPIRLCREDGPTVLLDNEGHIVFLYLPNFIYESTKVRINLIGIQVTNF